MQADQLQIFVQGFHSVMWIAFAMQAILAIFSLPLTDKAIKHNMTQPGNNDIKGMTGMKEASLGIELPETDKKQTV